MKGPTLTLLTLLPSRSGAAAAQEVLLQLLRSSPALIGGSASASPAMCLCEHCALLLSPTG